jgi:hypothetical protein
MSFQAPERARIAYPRAYWYVACDARAPELEKRIELHV